ncbi:MAG TPA: DUF4426 domain-containing protein [Gammaproteobacteria bacterium]|nr:DUF4426 domain-containing protein [Gammaproteobacteria bacterium]
MRNSVLNWVTVALTLAFLVPFSVQAEQAKDFGKYRIHYSAIQTSFLSPKVSHDYGISRSRNRIMLNIAVQEKTADGKNKSIVASVNVTATNLTGQLKSLSMRPIHDRDVIYYIGELSVANQETLDFKVDVKPENTKENLVFNFRQKFYTR